MSKLQFDIQCENFDYYFANQLKLLSPQDKDKLPQELQFKIYRGGGKLNSKSTSRLSFLSKLYILYKSLNKRWWIVVEDENGMTVEQFVSNRKKKTAPKTTIPDAENLNSVGSFILASKELGDTLSYLNLLSVSPAYNYLVKSKNPVRNKTKEWKQQMKYICRFLSMYEGRKKTLISQSGITIPEFLVLLYFYQVDEAAGSFLYKEFYKRAFQSSPTKIKTAFGTLQVKGYLEKQGATSGATFRITALGTDTMNSILDKYVINC